MDRNVLKGIAILAVALAAPAASADSHWYAGLSIGEAHVNLKNSDLNDYSTITNIKKNDSDTSYQFNAGYQANNYFAVEVGYIDFGKESISGVSDGTGYFWWPGPVKGKLKTHGYTLGFVGMIPVSQQFSLHGKIGALRWNSTEDLIDTYGTISVDDSGTDPYYGIGATYNFGRVALNADVIRYHDANVIKYNIDTMTVGIQVNF